MTKKNTPPQTRESNYELLRLLSQFYIVLYHILMLFVYPASQAVFFKAMWLPLHTGVILFVLLSGYFGIRLSSKGLVKLLGIFFVYNLSEVIYNVVTAETMGSMLHSVLFLSNSHFWFVKTYLFLYLASPILNACGVCVLLSLSRG